MLQRIWTYAEYAHPVPGAATDHPSCLCSHAGCFLHNKVFLWSLFDLSEHSALLNWHLDYLVLLMPGVENQNNTHNCVPLQALIFNKGDNALWNSPLQFSLKWMGMAVAYIGGLLSRSNAHQHSELPVCNHWSPVLPFKIYAMLA